MPAVPFVISFFPSAVSRTWILQTSPRFGTPGKRCASTAHGKGSISEKKTGSHFAPAIREAATENASTPAKSET
jgi:hypothetical protein